MIINLDESAFKAFITVTYPSGTCSLSHESGASYTHSGGGTHTFAVHRRGKWNIKAEDGTKAKEASVEISARAQHESLVLSYELLLFDSTLAEGYSLAGNYISPAIDLSPYKAMEVTAYLNHYYGYSSHIGICENPGAVSFTNRPAASFAMPSNNAYSNYVLDIEAFNSPMYIGFWEPTFQAFTFTVTGSEIVHQSSGMTMKISKIILR